MRHRRDREAMGKTQNSVFPVEFWAGLVGGAAVGAALLGPLGALLGAFAGAVLGRRQR